MAEVDDAEAVVIGVGQDHEVGVSRIQVPVHPLGAQRYQAVGLGGLLGGGGHGQVEMDAGVLLAGVSLCWSASAAPGPAAGTSSVQRASGPPRLTT